MPFGQRNIALWQEKYAFGREMFALQREGVYKFMACWGVSSLNEFVYS